MPLTSAEKTRNRNEVLNKITLLFSEQLPEFKAFAEKKWQGDITWRKFETFLKKKFGLSKVPGEVERYDALTMIAEQFAKENKDFQYFLIIRGEEESEPPTWRRLETFLKQQFEAGHKILISMEEKNNGHQEQKIRIVIESNASGD